MSIEKLSTLWPEWKTVEQIGEGSYGKVYKAVREEYGVTSWSAIKVISIPQSDSEIASLLADGFDEAASHSYFESIITDFVNEIRLMVSMKGAANIVSVEDYKVLKKKEKTGWDIFIRMELLTSFIDYMAGKRLTEAEVIRLGQDICSALELCAQRHIIHRDIKPENIFVSSFGDFKLGDFGIARELEKTSGSMSSKGTWNYMAPEVAAFAKYDPTVDTYSLGLVLYKLLNNNKLPFLSPDAQQIQYRDRKEALDRRLTGEPLPVPAEAGPQMAQLILKACAFNPAERFKTASELKKALTAVKDGNYRSRETDFTETDFTETDFTETDFTETVLTETDFTETDFTETDFTETVLTETDFTETVLTETDSPDVEFTEFNVTSVLDTQDTVNIPTDTANTPDMAGTIQPVHKGGFFRKKTLAVSLSLLVFACAIGITAGILIYSARNDNTSSLSMLDSDVSDITGNTQNSQEQAEHSVASHTTGNTPGNIINEGLAAVQDDMIYYSNSRDGGKLYAINKDGSNNIKLCDDNAHFINVIGDWIYYCNWDDIGKPFAIQTDGNGRTKINDDDAIWLCVLNNRIYYVSLNGFEQEIYTVKTDGSDKVKLGNGAMINVVGDRIYYEDNGLYSMKIDGSDQQKHSDVLVSCFNVDDDRIYYCDLHNNNLYVMRTDGSDVRKLTDDVSWQINVFDGRIFYSNNAKGHRLYSVNIDGSGRQQLNDNYTSYINVIGDRIYYLNIDDNTLYTIKIDGSDRQKIPGD